MPADDLLLLGSERVVTNQKPAILAVFPKRSLLGLERQPARQSGLSLVSTYLQVVRMEDSFSKAGSKHVVNRETGVIKRCLVGVDRRARRVQDHDRLRDRIAHAPKLFFILPKLRFRVLERDVFPFEALRK